MDAYNMVDGFLHRRYFFGMKIYVIFLQSCPLMMFLDDFYEPFNPVLKSS